MPHPGAWQRGTVIAGAESDGLRGRLGRVDPMDASRRSGDGWAAAVREGSRGFGASGSLVQPQRPESGARNRLRGAFMRSYGSKAGLTFTVDVPIIAAMR